MTACVTDCKGRELREGDAVRVRIGPPPYEVGHVRRTHPEDPTDLQAGWWVDVDGEVGTLRRPSYVLERIEGQLVAPPDPIIEAMVDEDERQAELGL